MTGKRGVSLHSALSEEKLQLRTAIGARVAWTAIGMYGLLPVTEGTISVPISIDHGTLLSDFQSSAKWSWKTAGCYQPRRQSFTDSDG